MKTKLIGGFVLIATGLGGWIINGKALHLIWTGLILLGATLAQRGLKSVDTTTMVAWLGADVRNRYILMSGFLVLAMLAFAGLVQTFRS